MSDLAQASAVEDLDSFRHRLRAWLKENMPPADPRAAPYHQLSDSEELAQVARHRELQRMLYDAGLLFVAYQRDPRKGFIPIFQNLAENDALGQFTTQTGSAIAAVPRAASGPGRFVGEGLFE